METFADALRPWLTTDELRARLDETEAHLDDGVAGRLELGMTREQAESDAVLAFGDPRAIAHALLEPSHGRWAALRQRWLTGAFAGLVGLFLSASILLERSSWAALLPIVCVAIGAAGLATAAFRSRKPAPRALLRAGAVSTLVLWCVMAVCFLDLGAYGGTGYQPRWERPAASLSDRFPEQALALREARLDPLGNALSQGPLAVATGVELTFGAVLVDSIFAGLAMVASSARRRKENA